MASVIESIPSKVKLAPTQPGHEIVLSGISGRFPDSNSIKELEDNLFNKVDLISDDNRRWDMAHPEIPRRSGKLKSLEKFDASFFGVDYKLAHSLDPGCRIVLEKTYECIIDAGFNPEELRNSKTGVFVASCFLESEKRWFYEKFGNADAALGCTRSMFANRVSDWLGIFGPSYAVDTACSSSLYALEHAVNAIRGGLCDAAIVAGVNLCLHPSVTLQFARMGALSKDGICSSFDDKANGYVRSECVVAVFLQKLKDSRRAYAQVVHAKTNCDGYKTMGITYPSGAMQKQLLEQFYSEIGVEPISLEYVEAHGTGTRAGDPEELNAIDKVFCAGRDRSNPLLIGSVKSNLGHAEPGSGIVSISKLLIAYNTGFIPPNRNYSTPRSGVLCLAEGRAKVVTEKTPWNRGMAGVNSFGFGGANAHALLKQIARDKVNGGLSEDNLPRLVCISGRTKSAVERILDELESKPVDVEQVRLWHAVHAKEIKGHDYRGYVLLGSTPENSMPIARHVQNLKSQALKPVILAYSSFETKWLEMSYDLMNISQFAAVIEKCQKVLKTNLKAYNNIADLTTWSIIGNTLVHIGLTDIYTSLEITPDYFIGHGVGELICAYADGLWTAEQTTLAAFEISIVLEKALQNKKGYLVQCNYEQTKLLCPVCVSVCYDSSLDWCVITGSANDVENVVTELKSKDVVVEQLPIFSLAYYTLDNEILKQLKNILPPMELHSSRWVSSLTELPLDVKQNCIVINAMSERMANLDILHKFNQRNVVNIDESNFHGQISFYISLGKLFEAGLNFELANIYPHVEFPVSQGTPMVSHLIEWDHSENWYVAKFDRAEEINISERKVSFSLEAVNDEFIAGHVIAGRVIYPATGYLVLAWETLAMMTGRLYSQVSVVFEDICFHRATYVPKEDSIKFTVTIHKVTGDFEIVEKNMAIVSGRIYEKPNVGKEFRVVPHLVQKTNMSDTKVLLPRDFYKELNLRGYQYKDLFRGVLACNIDGTRGCLLWRNNWVTFLDSMMQVKIISADTRSLYVPTRIEKVSIDVDLHADISRVSSTKRIGLSSYPASDVIRAGGVEIRGIHVATISRRPPLGIPLYEKHEFVPNYIDAGFSLADSLRTDLQLIHDNVQTFKFKIIEVIDEEYEKNKIKPCIEDIEKIMGDMPKLQAELHLFSEQPQEISPNIAVSYKKIVGETNVVLVVAANLLERPRVLKDCASTLKNKCYVLSRESTKPSSQANRDYDILTCFYTGTEYLVLLRKNITNKTKKTFIKVVTADETYSWINKVKESLKDGESLVLYSEDEPENGLLGLVNCLRKEPGGETVSGILVADQSAPPFNPNNPFYEEQLDKDLAVLVYKNGQWGTYRHLLLETLEKANVLHAYVNTATIGDLTSLCWWEGPYSNWRPENKSKETVIHVYSSALNFRDIMTAMGRVTLDAVARGRLAQDCVQGLEVAGKTQNGSRVMAICEKGISTLAKVDASFAFCIPDEWSFMEAATIPVAYSTVFLALVMIGKIRRGESILIHAGSGGVGQAAINVALHHGLEVFTTVGTPAKRQFVKTLFPQLKDSHIGNSRDTSFEEMIRRETGGRGVDLVLNSLADDKLKASANCLARRGRFIEIGKYDITVNTQLELCFMKRDISFHGVMLDYINDSESKMLKKVLCQLMIQGIASGAVRPLTYCTFDKENIETAYRYMAAGKHIGKVIIKIQDEERDYRFAKPSNLMLSAIPRYWCHPDEVYVLVGGLGGFGLELADWLVLRGARKLLISSRKGVTKGYQALRLKTWESYGTEIKILTDNVGNEAGCKKMLEAAAMMGTVKAIFNLAVVLCDAVFENQTLDTFKTSFAPKAAAAMHLDQLSRSICPELRDFVMFSSVSCGRGNAGQTNYGFSNSVMERICEQRKKDGFPALAIQWGAIGDVGLVADMREDNVQIEIGGTLQQSIDSCLQSMDMFLKQDAPIVSSVVVAEKKTAGTSQRDAVSCVARIIGIGDLKTVSHQLAFSELGMDSIMSVEIKQTLEREFEIFLTAQEIRGLTLAKLFELSTKKDTTSLESVAETDQNNSPAVLQILIRNLGDEKESMKPYLYVPLKATTEVQHHEKRRYDTAVAISMNLFFLDSLIFNLKTAEPTLGKPLLKVFGIRIRIYLFIYGSTMFRFYIELVFARGVQRVYFTFEVTKMASVIESIPSKVKLAPTQPGHEIVLSGISGRFPDSNSIKELEDNLFNKVDLISDDNRRWDMAHPEIPRRSGKLKSLEKFDASFFGVDYKLAHSLDPGCRIVLEKTYECIIDAGFNPEELRNSKTGVFVASCFLESEKRWFYEKFGNADAALGCTRSMFANRVSDWLGIFGPSYAVDTACSSSLYALEHAVNAIRGGLCDAAIVAGVNLCLHPSVTLQFARMGALSKDGICSSFDDKANGYVRSECVVAVFLQKLKDSRRAYAQVVHAKTNCDGYKTVGITYPSGAMQKQLLEQFYFEIGVEPTSLEYFEAHGTGTRAGDPEELNAIDKVFCAGRDRSNPLLIGSVKSNLGHAEAGSGIVSISKLLIAYNTGFIPPNRNYSTPRSGVLCLAEGRAKVVTEKTPWKRGMAGVNNFGFGGANAHALLKKIARDKVNGGLSEDNLPRLVCTSGRTKSAVERILDELESKPVDVEQVRLWHAVHAKEIKGHDYRGYVLLGSTPENSMPIARHVQNLKSQAIKPVILAYSSFGTKWLEMSYDLMNISQFAAAIEKCQKVLKINLKAYNNIADLTTWSIIGNTLVHIGLTDIYTSLEITPDYFIGHGVGELICAYADGLWTAEQTTLAAFEISVVLEKALQNKKGYLVQCNYEQTKLLCPDCVSVCYDSSLDWCVITGSANDVENVVTELKSKDVEVEQLPIFSLAYYTLDNEIIKQLKNILPPMELHSSRWVSSLTELPLDVKQNCIVINAMSERMANLDILHNFNQRNVVNIDQSNFHGQISFYISLGKLFEAGLNFDLANIYPHVKFPVSQGTPMVSHLIEWDHSENWYVARFDQVEEIKVWERKVSCSLDAVNYEFIAGHVIDGRVIYPATGYLVLAWETLTLITGRLYTQVSVVFEDIYFHRATYVPKEGSIEFTVTIHKSTGDFKIVEKNMAIVSGRIYEKPNVGKEFRVIPNLVQTTNMSDTKILFPKDFYKELNLRGYQYKDLFRGVLACTIGGSRGRLLWRNNWVTFLDTMLQLKIISTDTRSLYVPTRIEKVAIDVDLHAEITCVSSDNPIRYSSYPASDVIRAGGVEIRGIHVATISRRPPLGIPVYEKHEFVPNYIDAGFSLADSLRTDLQLIHDNAQTAEEAQIFKYKIIELIDEEYEKNKIKPCIEDIENIMGDMPKLQAELHVFSEQPQEISPNIAVSDKKIVGETNVVLVVAANLLERPKVLKDCASTLKNKCYLLSRESTKPSSQANRDYDILTCFYTGTEYLVLLRKKNTNKSKKTFIKVVTADETYSWINKVKESLKDGESLVLYNENEPENGLLGLVNCLRKEPGGETVSGILVADQSAPPFNPNNPFYKEQLDKELAVLVYKNGQWGTYRHLLLKTLDKANVLHAYVNTATIGDLTSLCWWEGPYSNWRPENNCEEIEIHVYSSALNFRDIMTAMGLMPLDAVARGRLAQDCVQGIEVAGKTQNGTRVMAICKKGISTLAKVDPSFAFFIPDEWSFMEAATIPVAYSTVLLALIMIGKIRRGESILIHAGSGGVGQAAINVALHHGLEVFTTVGTPAKRKFVKTLFPQLKDSHIGNSRDTSFEEMICRETGGRGVDLVLNSLADDKLKASANCLARRGRFIEIGKHDIIVNTQLELCFMKKDISFHGVMLDYINDSESKMLRKILCQLMLHGIASGAVRPLTYCTFDKENIVTAYRYMAAGKHIGKVIIKIQDEERDYIFSKPSNLMLSAIPRYWCHPDEVYVLVGGLGGFGLELADWLVLRGARKLLISSRKGVTKGYQALRLKTWESYGTEIKISTDHVANEAGCKKMLEAAAMMGTVKAIFNLAVVLCDAVFENQTLDTFKTSFAPKAAAAMHLDKLSKSICPELRDFVMFSSVSCGRGNARQTNYAFSNSVMERICEKRKKDGFPALAIQWGAIVDVGSVADKREDNVQIEIGGTLQQSIDSCLQSMDMFLKQDAPIVSSVVVAEKNTAGTSQRDAVSCVAQIIGIGDLKTVSHQLAFSELGMDSIIAVEIKQTLEREFEICLTAQEIRGLTLAKLFELSTKKDTTSLETVAETDQNNSPAVLQILIRNLGDEKESMKPYLYVPSKATTTEVQPEIAEISSNKVLFVLPGIESAASVLVPLCNKLNINSYILQLGADPNEVELDQIVEKLYKMIKPLLAPGTPFHFLGYSFGSIPLLALTARLESEGHSGMFIALDGSLDYVYTVLASRIAGTSDFDLQNAVLMFTVNYMLSVDKIQTLRVYKKLNVTESIHERAKIVHSVTGGVFSEQYIANVAVSIANRLKITLRAKETKALKKIKSPIVLIRPKDLPVGTSTIDESYGLGELTEEPIAVHYLDSDHINIMNHEQSSTIINTILTHFVKIQN